MRILLIGFMGAGKSTVAKILASLLPQLRVIEMDDLITENCGFPDITSLVKTRGEPEFRSIEEAVAKRLVNEENCIISAGGGVVEFPDTISSLLEGGTHVVYLATPFASVLNRIPNTTSRPLLQDIDKARARYATRLPLYQQYAHQTIDTAGLTPHNVASQISDFVYPPETEAPPTGTCFIIGDPVAHSLSPLMHTAGYRACKIEEQWAYGRARVTEHILPDALTGIRALNIRGVSVTMPHKSAVIPLLDKIDPQAARMGAVNTVVREGEALVGYNTDGLGVVAAIARRREVQGARVILFGAGGAARAAAVALSDAGAHVSIWNRTQSKAEELAVICGGDVVPSTSDGVTQALSQADIVLQCTSIGMHPNASETPIDCSLINNQHLVFETIYFPRETTLLREARHRGASSIEGWEMLLEQGLAQFKLYTGHNPPREEMERALLSQGKEPL